MFRYYFRLRGVLVIVMCLTYLSGCAAQNKAVQSWAKETFDSDDPCSHNARNIGVAIGAAAGLATGLIFEKKLKNSSLLTVMTVLGGGALGGLIGAEIDDRRCKLYKIAKKNNLEIEFEDIDENQVSLVPEGNGSLILGKIMNTVAPEENKSPVAPVANKSPDKKTTPKKDDLVGLKVVLKDNGRQFASGSAVLTPEAATYFKEIADQYTYHETNKDEKVVADKLRKKSILLVGHTDDVGGSSLNAELSEHRAKAVAKIFKDRGVPEDRLFFQGAGETLPIADNRTDEGRAKNRRVEIIDLSDDASFNGYLNNRKPILAYYRNSTTDDKHKTTNEAKYKQPSKDQPELSQSPKSDKESVPEPPATSVTVKTAKQKTSTKSAKVNSIDKTRKKPETPGGRIDFGGSPATTNSVTFDIGRLESKKSTFSFISVAQADTPVLNSCAADRPRVGRGVKTLTGRKEYITADYMPNLYGTSWFDKVNGHLVSLTHVSVLRDGGVPSTNPELLIYKDYSESNRNKKADSRSTPEVNTYRGDKGILYRVFAKGPIRCMDIVIPYAQMSVAKGSTLYYDRDFLYVNAFSPRVAK